MAYCNSINIIRPGFESAWVVGDDWGKVAWTLMAPATCIPFIPLLFLLFGRLQPPYNHLYVYHRTSPTTVTATVFPFIIVFSFRLLFLCVFLFLYYSPPSFFLIFQRTYWLDLSAMLCDLHRISNIDYFSLHLLPCPIKSTSPNLYAIPTKTRMQKKTKNQTTTTTIKKKTTTNNLHERYLKRMKKFGDTSRCPVLLCHRFLSICCLCVRVFKWIT